MNIDKLLYKEIKDWLYHKASDKPITLGDEKVQILIDKIKKQLPIGIVSDSFCNLFIPREKESSYCAKCEQHKIDH